MAKFTYQTPDGQEFEIDATDIMTATREGDAFFARSTPDAYGNLPQGEAGADPAALNAPAGPFLRAAGRVGAQAVGTGLGVAGGTAVGNVPGAVVGGAGGNVLAGQLYDAALDHILGTNERPPLASPSTAVDAVVGGVAPAVGPVMTATGRAVMRGITGQTGEAGTRRLGLQAIDLANDASGPAAARAAEFAERTGQRIEKLHRRTANVGAVLAALHSGNISTAAAWWLVGHGTRHFKVPQAAIERAFMRPEFVNWLAHQPAANTRRQVARAVAASIAEGTTEQTLGLSEREAQDLVDSAPRPVFQRGTMKWHDPDTGRIIGAGTVGIDGWTVVDGERVRRATADDMLVSRAPEPEDE